MVTHSTFDEVDVLAQPVRVILSTGIDLELLERVTTGDANTKKCQKTNLITCKEIRTVKYKSFFFT